MRRRIFTTAIALMLACSDSNTGPPAETGSIQLAASAAAVTLGPAGNAVVTVTLARAGGYTGDVVLAVSGLPSGMTAW